MEQFRKLMDISIKQVEELGSEVGYGFMMSEASNLWKKSLEKKGYPSGGEFVVGPCAAMTVPCGCEGDCDWCCGCGWLTEIVANLKKEMESGGAIVS